MNLQRVQAQLIAKLARQGPPGPRLLQSISCMFLDYLIQIFGTYPNFLIPFFVLHITAATRSEHRCALVMRPPCIRGPFNISFFCEIARNLRVDSDRTAFSILSYLEPEHGSASL